MKNQLIILATAILAINASATYAAATPKIAELVKKCDTGDMAACTLLGAAYNNGKGVTQDFVKASKLFQQTCDAGDIEDCINIGSFYYYGTGVKQDYSKAKELLSKSCKSGLPQGCDWDKALTEKGY